MFLFPWSNIHELNLDWVLSKVKDSETQIKSAQDTADSAIDGVNKLEAQVNEIENQIEDIVTPVTIVKTVASSGADFTNIVDALMWFNQRFNDFNANHRGLIEVDAGFFSLGDTMYYVAQGMCNDKGLFLPPYCKIKGKGKDKTTLFLRYNGTDGDLTENVSGLNMPYESGLEDLTIAVKNVRYTIHSDGGMVWFKDTNGNTVNVSNNNALINNNNIVLKNVALIHEGIDNGAAWNSPSAWGSGSWSNANQYFYNCDFLALANSPWFNHTHTGVFDPSTFYFENCTFINGQETNPQLNSSYSSLGLISWGAECKIAVALSNCIMNHGVAMYPTDTNTCDYYLVADNDITVLESVANNAQLTDNYYTGVCDIGLAYQSIQAYTPVSEVTRYNIRPYSVGTAWKFSGIALHSAAVNGRVVFQKRGMVYIPSLTNDSTLYAAGKLLGYNNGWIEDNINPLVKVTQYGIGVIIEEHKELQTIGTITGNSTTTVTMKAGSRGFLFFFAYAHYYFAMFNVTAGGITDLQNIVTPSGYTITASNDTVTFVSTWSGNPDLYAFMVTGNEPEI